MLIYFSQTGNTQLLAQAIKKNVENSDIIYIGFWTDKGNASKEALDYLKTLHHQKIFLFGTAGFGKSDNYFKKVALKEVQEESGLENVSFMSDDLFSLEVLTVDGHVKRGKYVSSHLHYNVTYLMEANDQDELKIKEDENKGLRWFSFEDALKASTEPWFVENIYSKLNSKVKDYLKR